MLIKASPSKGPTSRSIVMVCTQCADAVLYERIAPPSALLILVHPFLATWLEHTCEARNVETE